MEYTIERFIQYLKTITDGELINELDLHNLRLSNYLRGDEEELNDVLLIVDQYQAIMDEIRRRYIP